MQSDTSALQRELLGDRDYHSRNEDYTMPDPQEAAKAALSPQGSPKANSFMRRASQGKLTKKEIEDFRAAVSKRIAEQNGGGGLTFGGESVTNNDGSVALGGLVSWRVRQRNRAGWLHR